jgi:CcmD family protein
MVEARNFTYMFYGFLAAWMILMAYVVTLVARERNLKKQLTQLKSMLDDRTR